jgi:hypothetical protein
MLQQVLRVKMRQLLAQLQIFPLNVLKQIHFSQELFLKKML